MFSYTLCLTVNHSSKSSNSYVLLRTTLADLKSRCRAGHDCGLIHSRTSLAALTHSLKSDGTEHCLFRQERESPESGDVSYLRLVNLLGMIQTGSLTANTSSSDNPQCSSIYTRSRGHSHLTAVDYRSAKLTQGK